MVKKVDTVVEDVTKKASDGKFPGGETLTYGLDQDGVGISPSKQNLSDDVIKAVDKWKKKSSTDWKSRQLRKSSKPSKLNKNRRDKEVEPLSLVYLLF